MPAELPSSERAGASPTSRHIEDRTAPSMPADLMSRPLERAQLVWRRAIQLAGPRAFHDRFGNALDLLRTAHHDPATMAHALSIGRGQLQSDAGDATTRAAVEVLEAAIAFLGVKPRAGELTPARSPRRQRAAQSSS